MIASPLRQSALAEFALAIHNQNSRGLDAAAFEMTDARVV
jgi:hypothetical protein